MFRPQNVGCRSMKLNKDFKMIEWQYLGLILPPTLLEIRRSCIYPLLRNLETFSKKIHFNATVFYTTSYYGMIAIYYKAQKYECEDNVVLERN